jgi:transcriptional regulator with XRE-family HTH domain
MKEETFQPVSYTRSLSKLKLARMHRGLRQMDLARSVGISESYLSKIETGRATPSDALLSRVSEALGLDVSDLVGVIESPSMGKSA